jgi:cytochrome b
MGLTPQGARQTRIWVITLCIIGGALLPFFIPGAAAVRAFTDIEARIGYGVFSVLVHALIGAVIGTALAEFVVWARGGARDVDVRRRSASTQPPNDAERR